MELFGVKKRICINSNEFYFRVKVNHKTGLIDTNGVEILKPEFYAIQTFQSDGHELAIVTKDKSLFLINLSEQKGTSYPPYESIFIDSYSPDLDFILVKKNGLYGFIDYNEKIKISYQFTNAKAFEGKYASVQIGDKYFIVNRLGEKVLEY